MRLIDADKLLEHVGRDRLDSRELITQMIENAPTVNLNSYKPCPWCGGHASMHIDSMEGQNGTGYKGAFKYYVQCDNCFTKAPAGTFYDIDTPEEDAKQNAIDAWNRRRGE